MIEQFLQQVELKAYKMALMATKSEADALDLVQNTMLKLVEKYADRPQQELKPLFYAILQNQIKNWFRQSAQINKWLFWKKSAYDDDDEHHDSGGQMLDGVELDGPEVHLQNQQESTRLLTVLSQLPVKQQQCFLLRSWEGLSVKETAKIMQCSEGTVKTHMSRASHKLQSCIATEEFVQ